MNFYSAREEPEPVPKANTKKGPPKKITNQAIMEHLIAVQAQMKVIQSDQERLRRDQASPATPAAAPFTPMPATSKMPGLSAGLQGPQVSLGNRATMTSYMEKQGGYRNSKDTALCLWIAAHAMDSAMAGDEHGTKEFLALLVTCLDQASYDGNWNVAYLLSLLEVPPATVFSDRVQNVPGLERPFSPLVPQPWAACALAYMKEVDLLSTKKTEPAAPKAPTTKASETDPAESPSPRRRPKFPKKPKGSPDPKAS